MMRYKAVLSVILASVLTAGALSACGGAQPVKNAQEQVEELVEEAADEIETETEEALEAEAEEAAYDVCTLYLGGAEDASAGMEMVDDEFNDDGTYRNEYVSDDGMLSIVEVGKLWTGNEPESLEENAIEMARWTLLRGDTSSEETVELNDAYSEKVTYPVYVVSFMTGSNEDTWSWKAYTVATDTCGLVYAVGAPADFDEDMIALTEEYFPKLRVIDKDEGLETNEGDYKTDLLFDFPSLQYDDSYKSAEGTTEISIPTEEMEKMSDGLALAGPFFSIDKDGTVVAVNYGGTTYCICEICVGMSMEEAADLAKTHDFTFSHVEIAHGTAKYVSIYDNGEYQLCIASDADGDTNKTEESDVTGNVDSILISKL